MPSFRYVVADVFTDTPLQGNQLAVFTDARELDDATMQALALEIGFSETVYVLPAESEGHARIRIFTPTHELPFAGHPVLGSAFVLGAPLQLGAIGLETGSGLLTVVLERDELGKIVFGRMQQPVPRVADAPDQPALLDALGLQGSTLPIELYDNGVEHVYVGVAGEQELAALDPDVRALAGYGAVGVNCFAGGGDTWTVRMFAPGLGVAEDAATGSAAGPLVCHLCRHGLVEWGGEITVSQGTAIGRPSTLFARAAGGGGLIDRVEVGGSAVVVARGEFRLPS